MTELWLTPVKREKIPSRSKVTDYDLQAKGAGC